jgi:demethylmenaquinone methyltransferase/2-methoxy-6-polyprenyl-1,4-benzoquinol methylase
MSDKTDLSSLVQDQIEYYRARANEYDQWFFRQGRYDQGEALNRLWFQEVEQVRLALRDFKPAGQVLELACGTGLWTQQIVAHADRVLALDSSAEAIALNLARLKSAKVEYRQADIFDWQPQETCDVVFFGFWLSHVPPDRFATFWHTVAQALKPGGRVFFVDSRYSETSSARDHMLEGPQATTIGRRLNDGREYRIVKVFYQPQELQTRLAGLGFRATVRQTSNYFIYGQAELA